MAISGIDKRFLIQDLIEVFSIFLSDRHIVIDNPEKEETPWAENLYGTDYGDIYDGLEEVLVVHGVIADER